MNWTKEQQKVISLRNRSMLISAAAGSGKTAVLVERIISMITDKDHPIDIDRLLVVTFTRAAASEMRERIGRAIEEALKRDPFDPHLQRQLTLVHNAQITTIDSFCTDVLRSHFHRIDLEPGFRIADEGELKLLREDVCDQVLETFYAAGDPEFLRFADSYSNAKNDGSIREMILRLYDYADSYPWPEEWLAGCAGQYRAADEEELERKPWAENFLAYLRVRTADIVRRHRQLLALTEEEDGPSMYRDSISDDLCQLEGLMQAEHFSQWQQALAQIRFRTIGNARKYEGSEEKKQAVADGRNRMKKQIEQIRGDFFAADIGAQLARMEKTARMVDVLVSLTRAFGERFAREKEEKNILDFSDVEHKALNILVDPQTKEPTETAAEYRQQFAEVMIDEYQDSNYVQETLLRAVSGISEGRENLFMVGDVKQSIYRFRLARPELFMDKYRSFSTEDGVRQRIDLHKNFRSRREVLDFVNDVFYRIMGEDLGNVEYDQKAALYAGAEYPDYEDPGCCRPELIVIPAEQGGDKKQAEAVAVAGRIRELVKQQEIPGVRYRDIVILLRSLSGWAESFQKVFEREGIPLIVSSQTGYFSAGEVQTVLSMLRILDNPRQDIPLAAVMKSPIGGFSSEELARMRAAYPKCAFYRCAMLLGGRAREESGEFEEQPVPGIGTVREKLLRFWEMIGDFRSRVPYTPVHRLLQEIIEESGYGNYVTAQPAGEQRRANLNMLIEKAIAYEKTSYHGLFHFIRYIDRLIKYDVDFGEAEIVSEQEDAVRLMSIHKSKGLEFPVVFVSGMGKEFNRQDMRGNMIFHPDYGVGLKWLDHEKRTKSDTLIRRIFALEAEKESLGEELRVLYVALTRAREKLILTGSGEAPVDGSVAERMPAISEATRSAAPAGEKLDFSDRFDVNCYWDWIFAAVAGSGRYPIRVWDAQEQSRSDADRRADLGQSRQRILAALNDVPPADYESVDRMLSWEYPYAGKNRIRQKVSVSELKHRAIEEARELSGEPEEAALFPNEIPVPYVPKFVQEAPENAGALFGTAVHRFFECFDFAGLSRFPSWKAAEAFIGEQIRGLVEKGRMKAEDADRLNPFQIYGFLKTDAAWRMRESARAGKLTKEKPFVMSVPAGSVWEEADGEESVLIQGIIDVFWEEADGIVLLDYKTDRVQEPEELIRRYERQLSLYAQALTGRFPQKRVKEILIYSFCLGTCITVGKKEND